MSKNDMYIVTRWETVSISELIQIHDPNDNPEDAYDEGNYTSIQVLDEQVLDSGWTDFDEAVLVERTQYVWRAKPEEDN